MLPRCEFVLGSAAEAAQGNISAHTDSALIVAGILEDTRLCRTVGAGAAGTLCRAQCHGMHSRTCT